MDLLYSLQTIRMTSPDWLVSVIMIISDSVILMAPLVAFCTFWSIDKKKGYYFFVSLGIALLLNELTKVTFCVYRPWILDARLTPAAQAFGTATNYSFPSSHSTAAVCVCAALAFAFPGNKIRTIITSLFVILVMFSRMFLGCHSLVDVCVGAGIGLCVAFLMRPMLKDSFDMDRFTKVFLVVSLCLSILGIIYVLKKNYPLDYNPDGSLIVNPKDMFPDTVGICGAVAGLGVGLFIERKFINFPMSVSKKEAILRSAVGIICFSLMYTLILKRLFSPLDASLGKFLRYFICLSVFTTAYPALFKTRLFKGRQG